MCEKDRQTDRQTDKLTDRQTERQTDRQTNKGSKNIVPTICTGINVLRELKFYFKVNVIQYLKFEVKSQA